MLGGDVSGGKVLGKYPERLEEGVSEVNINRGRILPTKPWEAVWNGVAQWWDISMDAETQSRVLPLAENWPGQELFNRTHMFLN